MADAGPPAPPGPSPARFAPVGGVGVVLATGLAGLAGFGANDRMTPIDWVLAALVAVCTIGGAIALARLVRRHGGEIGEARFDTRNPDHRED